MKHIITGIDVQEHFKIHSYWTPDRCMVVHQCPTILVRLIHPTVLGPQEGTVTNTNVPPHVIISMSTKSIGTPGTVSESCVYDIHLSEVILEH